jgi:hypothetical protein
MSEERRKVLDMLSEGKISAEEAEKLLDAVEPEPRSGIGGSTSPDGMPKNLFIRVLPKEGAENADQVKVTVPIALVKAGINFLSLLPNDARKGVETAMEDKGFDFDLKNLGPEEMDALLAAIQELEIDVETSDSTVRIYAG